jgi:negative regulator of sigma-B (phosphoserine phosphatase)
VLAVSPGDLLVLATDGIRPDFTTRVTAGDDPQALADRILAECSTGTDDALVVVVRYQRARARRSS